MNLQDMDLEQYNFSKKELYKDNEKWIHNLSFYYSLVKICLLEDFFFNTRY